MTTDETAQCASSLISFVGDVQGVVDLAGALYRSPHRAVLLAADGTPWMIRTDVHRDLFGQPLTREAHHDVPLDPVTFLRELGRAEVLYLRDED